MGDVKPAMVVTPIEVTRPNADADAGAVRDLFLEYAEALGHNTCLAGFDEELLNLPGNYGPPRGCLLLARVDGVAAGCVGVRPIDGTSCEMKRLYVRPDYRRCGLGRRLAETVIARARGIGYRRLFLDTLPAMREAHVLYAALGFRRCAPYYDNSLLGSDCFELALQS